MVLLGRFELPASPLPRECSTPELQQPDKQADRWAMVLLGRFELPASPLPRECSTPELQQHEPLRCGRVIGHVSVIGQA